MKDLRIHLIAVITMLFALSTTIHSQIITPKEFFGFQPGSDRNLFKYEKLIDYLQELDAASPKLKMVKIGESPLGKEMYIAFISSAENLANLDKLKSINKKL